jgi:uncharacterized protein
MTQALGKVAGLSLYPVQSLRGEDVEVLDFTAGGFTNGPAGDRAFAIADLEVGKIAHASRPNREWLCLIAWRARYVARPEPGSDLPPVEISFPDGSSVRSDDTRIDAVLSDQGGHRFALVRNGDGRFAPVYKPDPCHILTSATLAALTEACPEGDFAPQRFRPNLFIDMGPAKGFVEETWMGKEVAIGAARFVVSEACKRCALVTRAQGDLPDDKRILQTVNGANKSITGVYARIAKPGRVALGDALRFPA